MSIDLLSAKLPPLAPIIALAKYSWCSCKKMWNWWGRPKIEIKFKPNAIQVRDENDKIFSSSFVPSIIITPRDQELEIKIGSIRVGRYYYDYLSGGFSALNGKKHDSKILNYLNEKTLYIKTSKYEPLIIPLPTIGMHYDSYLFMKHAESRLFFSDKKITLSFEANGKMYHYGLNALDVSRIVINHLSHNCKELKTIKSDYKQYIL